MRLRIAQQCHEDFESMAVVDAQRRVRACEVCGKNVHTILSEADARAALRDARRRKESSVCVSVAVSMALTACAPETTTVRIGPIAPPAPPTADTAGGGSICDIDPSACPPGPNAPLLATTAEYRYELGRGEVLPETGWERFVHGVRGMFQHIQWPHRR